MSKKTMQDFPPDKTCFLVCPMGEDDSPTRRRSDDVLKYVISPAIERSGLIPVRADMISSPGMITTQIITHILKDKLVIADLSEHNPNVFYEVALRHAFHRPIIQIIQMGQKLPFDIAGLRTIPYKLDLEGVSEAREQVERQVDAVLADGYEVESPVTIAAKIDDLTRTGSPQNQAIIQSIMDQIEMMHQKLDHFAGSVFKAEDFNLKETIPPLIQDRLEDVLHRYAEEIELLKSVRYAGVTGIFKRREMALKAFARALDEESTEIMIIGSSLKGLLQRDEYSSIAQKIRFKADRGLVQVKFMLTHPIVADFRANQENRRRGEIGREIIASLGVLQQWKIPPQNVRLYLGTPTCFAIKTTRQMLINPYPYISVSFDSPCLHVEYSIASGVDRPGYFFDEFNSRHFGAWDTDLAVHITDYQSAIDYYSSMLDDYAQHVEDLIAKGKACV